MIRIEEDNEIKSLGERFLKDKVAGTLGITFEEYAGDPEGYDAMMDMFRKGGVILRFSRSVAAVSADMTERRISWQG